MVKREETMVILAYIAVCIIWGSTYLAIRIGVSDFPPELFAGIRFLIAGSLVLLFAYFKGYKFPGKCYRRKKTSNCWFIFIDGWQWDRRLGGTVGLFRSYFTPIGYCPAVQCDSRTVPAQWSKDWLEGMARFNLRV